MFERLYTFLMKILTPALHMHLWLRATRGKEDPRRLAERRGFAGRKRPEGGLVWIHGASVGESLSVLPLIERIQKTYPGKAVLVTTGTVTSARLMEKRLPSGAFHQFMPLDCPAWTRRFLEYWRPDVVLWVESDLWPVMLGEIRRRKIPAALVNARMSVRSFRRWKCLKKTARNVLSVFRICLAQTKTDAEHFSALGALRVEMRGNIKFSAAPLPARDEDVADMRVILSGRPAWLFASTHPGEEEIALKIHEKLAGDLPGLLTIIAPRHPARAPEIEALVKERGFTMARRSRGQVPADETPVWLTDTMGELGLFFRLVPVAVIGGSFVPHGGHNPIEPAQLGCAIVCGPHMFNFTQVCAALEEGGGLRTVSGAEDLAPVLDELLSHPQTAATLARAAHEKANQQRSAADAFMEALAPLFAQA